MLTVHLHIPCPAWESLRSLASSCHLPFPTPQPRVPQASPIQTGRTTGWERGSWLWFPSSTAFKGDLWQHIPHSEPQSPHLTWAAGPRSGGEDSAQKEQAIWMDVRQRRDFLVSNTEALGTLTVTLPRDSSAGIGQRRGADHGRNGATSRAFHSSLTRMEGPMTLPSLALTTSATTFGLWPLGSARAARASVSPLPPPLLPVQSSHQVGAQ